MKRVWILCWVAVWAVPGFATIHVVTLSGFSFSPASITVQQGDTVRWVKTTGFHNVAETSGVPVFRSGDPTSSAFTYDFVFSAPLAGAYSYQCDAHFSLGMTGTVTVNAPAPCLSPSELTIQLAGNANAREFHWLAPQPGQYEIYSTPDAFLNTSPPGAGWTLEGSTVVGGQGMASLVVAGQTEDGLFYVVIQNCAN